MEFTISTYDIVLLMSKLFSGICSKSEDEISGKVLIEAYDATLKFYATDGSLITTFNALDFTIKEEGSCLFLYGRLAPFVYTATEWDEETETGTKEFLFKSITKNGSDIIEVKRFGRSDEGKKFKSTIKLNSFPAYEFMKPDTFSNASFSMNSTMYKNGIYKISYAVNKNSTLEFIRGVNIKITTDHIVFTGTDSVVLTEYRFKNVNKTQVTDIHVPLDFILTLKKCIYSESDLFFDLTPTKIIVKFANMEIASPIILGDNYPDCTGMFESFESTVSINKTTLLDGVRSVLGVSDKDDNYRLTVKIEGNSLELYNDFSDYSCEDSIEFDGELIIDLNGALLRKSIESVNDDTLLLKFSDENGYFIIDSYNFQDQKTLINNIRRR